MKSRALDPARTLALLWGAHGNAGRSGLSVRTIVAAAIEIADAEGLEAAVMRRVAEHLGVGTMSLYTHVPGKTELTALMADTVLGELYPATRPGSHDDWRDGLRAIAHENWALYERHPWLPSAVDGRGELGPNVMRKYELELAPLDGIGLTDVEMDSTLTMLLVYVEGVWRTRQSLRRAHDQTGLSDAEWWQNTGPVLERVMGGSQFPLGGRVGTAAGQQHNAMLDPAHALSFGLDRIIDGITRLIDRKP
ncbi:TetR/AcrR family transcriptional regulator C-terminal domain-containing protein [Catenuloplanes sp. NPDC051500]|uniref:TetR/AcrR family transcriptional regulator C-terminal domain-containing protein n=1 Tax=Catenuloplanes sp. NPDC051500 TaxID=3363959 RepID=UPI003795769E